MPRILVADPSPVLRRELVEWSRAAGHDVLIARELEEALRHLNSSPPPDLVVLREGERERTAEASSEALRVLRTTPHGARVPMLVCTWSNQVSSLARLVFLGADRCLQWPAGREDFLEAVQGLLETRVVPGVLGPGGGGS